MSITPLPTGTAALPAAPTGDPAAGRSGSASDGSFAALVATLLGRTPAPGVPAPPAAGAVPGGAGEAVGGTGDAGAEDPAAAADEVDGQVVAPVWTPVLDGLVLAPATGAPAAAGAGQQVDGVASAPTTAAGQAATPALPQGAPADGAATDGAATAGAATAPATGPAAPGPVAGPAAPGAAPIDAAPIDAAPSDAAPTDAAGGTALPGADAAAPAATSTAPGSTQPAPTAPTTAAPAVVPTTAAASTPTAPADGARPAPVVAQVVPEVTRLVSRGDGVHRLTMRLQPEGLGDVRVTLTVRDGQVDVRLTAGDDARRALAEGAPELRRVLELTGATEARVVVRDLAGTTTAGQQGWTTTSGGAGQQDSWTSGTHGGGDAPGRGEAGPQDQHAGTRGGAAARDGHTDGATALRPDPAGRAPRAVDLTM
jgi:hypothetical protein